MPIKNVHVWMGVQSKHFTVQNLTTLGTEINISFQLQIMKECSSSGGEREFFKPIEPQRSMQPTITQQINDSMEKARAAFTNEWIWGAGPAVLPTGLSGRATPKNCSGSLYAAEPKWWFTDTQCNVTFISVVAIIARVV